MNKLTVSLKPEQDSESDEQFLRAIIKVDNEPLVNFSYFGLAVDLGALQKSALEAGEFFIITCSCGDPQCAGIRQGIQVSHKDQRVTWVYKTPLPNPVTQPELVRPTASRRPEWVVRGVKLPTKTFIFDSAAYKAEILQGLKRGAHLLRQYDAHMVRVLPECNRKFLERSYQQIGSPS